MSPDMSVLLALHKASEKLLDAHNAAKAAGREDLAEHARAAQHAINRALAAVAKDQSREVVS